MPSKLRQFIDGEDMSVILRQEEDLGANDSYRKVPAVNAPLEQGLTAAQVRERKQNGYANVSNEKNTKSVSDIIKSNVFTYFNGVFIVLAILMFVGACSGSTTGGFKSSRALMILKVIRNEFMHMMHPRAVLPVKINGKALPSSMVHTLLMWQLLPTTTLFM